MVGRTSRHTRSRVTDRWPRRAATRAAAAAPARVIAPVATPIAARIGSALGAVGRRTPRRCLAVCLVVFPAVFVAGFLSAAYATHGHPDGAAAAAAGQRSAEPASEVTVGMSAEIRQIVLPGSRLISRPVDPRTTPIVLRIDGVYPHGDQYRYDITWFGMTPGDHDLSRFLAREDGTSADDLPEIPVTVHSVLPPERIRPHAPSSGMRVSAGGYRRWLWFGGFLWVCGLVVIGLAWRSRSSGTSAESAASPLSRLQRIERLLDQAAASGRLEPSETAQLEGLILGFWRDRKHLQDADPRDALTRLRSDPDAGPLLRHLERWLYDRPDPADSDSALRTALEPLRRIVAESAADDESTAADESEDGATKDPATSVTEPVGGPSA